MVDYYATEETRAKQIKLLARNEAKLQQKRTTCREYCAKFLEHVQVLRKDLLNLESNEDALELHEELRTITETMSSFGIGLEDSVMKEPTRINLADWKNLCLFRVAIIRRRITATSLYIEKTGSAETLIKIEAFLYAIWRYLTTGEWDEYEMETIAEEPFFNVSFLLCQSSIQEPADDIRKSANDAIPVHAVKLTPTKSPIKAEIFPDSESEQDTESGSSKDGESPRGRSKPENEISESSEPKPNHPCEGSSELESQEQNPDSPPTRQDSDSQLVPEPEIKSHLENQEPEQSAFPLPEIVVEDQKEVIEDSTDNSNQIPTPDLSVMESSKKKKNKLESPSSVRHIKQKRTHSDKPDKPRSPLMSRFVGKQEGLNRSIARFTGKKKEKASTMPPLLNGNLERLQHSGKRKWKNFWVVLNVEKLEFYKDERCTSLMHVVKLENLKKLSVVEPGESSPESEGLRKSAKLAVPKDFQFVLYTSTESNMSNQIELAATSKISLLKWCILLHNITSSKYDTSLLSDSQLDSFVKEVYYQGFGSEYAIKRGEGKSAEQWVYNNGKLLCVGKNALRCIWDGLSFRSSQSGDELARWDGLNLQWNRIDREPDLILGLNVLVNFVLQNLRKNPNLCGVIDLILWYKLLLKLTKTPCGNFYCLYLLLLQCVLRF